MKQDLESKLKAADEQANAAEQRLGTMVTVGELQRQEALIQQHREELKTQDREARQLRVALAEALASGTDLPNTMQELTLLKESTSAATERVRALEDLNVQIGVRISEVNDRNAKLKKGTFDLQNEKELMREVIVQQNETLLRKVEDLTDERKTADADRKQLLAATAEVMLQVDSAEGRIAKRPNLEVECVRIQANQDSMTSEVERLRRTNLALATQIFGEDG